MGNLHYEVKFTGGTGLMANARGKAEIDGFGLFAEDFASGKATWVMLGTVSTRNRRHDD